MTLIVATNPRFRLGQIVGTPGALQAFTPEEIAQAVQRHSQCDWGAICDSDAHENQMAIKERLRILSAYEFHEEKLWVITEADRSATTVLLPSEY